MTQLSITQIMMFWRCGPQYDFRYIQGLRMPPGAALISGTGTHTSIRANLTNKKDTGELLPIEAVKDIASDAVHHRIDDEGIYLEGEDKDKGFDKVMAECVDTAVTLSALHHTELAPNIEPVGIEQWWSLDIGDTGSKLRGVIDLIEKDGTVVDHKTASKSPIADAADISPQLTTYALARYILTGQIPELRLDHLVKTETPKTVIQKTTRTKEQIGTFLFRIQNALDAIQSGVFIPASPDSFWCSRRWCGYWSMCKYFDRSKLGRD